ncbi:MAG TPA: ankyrin repeat domain-containing protein [Bryobacteraceae bacterium]|nr:ankyrin repeat domain-containing protein [Bryobacteraceae bacterium]
MRRILYSAVCLLVLTFAAVQAQDASERFYQAIRNNDLASLNTLVKTSDVNVKDQRESTPLMYAAAYGSLDAMRLLIGAGADVNAKNAFAVTPLLWCTNDINKVRLLVDKGADVNARSKQAMTPLLIAALHDGASPVVKLLLDKGANVSVRGTLNTTPLLSATGANDLASVRLLLEKDADVNAKDLTGQTPLMNAALNGNVEIIKRLLAKGANVNAVGAAGGGTVKNGPIALGLFTPLIWAATYGSPEAIQVLLDAGAKVNVQDIRGMTPLMLAVGSDHADPRVIRMLLAKGADPNIKSKDGETAVDWARKFGQGPVLDALGVERKQVAAAPIMQPATESKTTPKEAVQKGLVLLQKASNGFFTEGGCVSCHAQNLTAMAVAAARANHIPVDEASAAEQIRTVKLQWTSQEQVLLQRLDPPGASDTIMYSVLQLAVEGAKPDHAIDAMIHNIAGEQRQTGNWSFGGIARPPMEDGDFSRTALCLRALKTYTIPGRQAEFEERIRRATLWLMMAKPRSTEERTMQLLGLKWSGATNQDLQYFLSKLVVLQRPDGGWSQTPDLASDAYATGQALYTMHELGIPSSDAAYRRGVAYLLKTQLPDGSWHVASRAPKFQPYFQSGFPHDHDQWISSSATAWAAIALAYASSDKPAVAAR